MRFLFGECTLDAEARELKRAGRTVHVEPQVFDVLVHLINRHDRVVSKDELIAMVWHGRIVSDSTLNSRINAARQAIGDSGQQQSFIRTVARRGFRFVGDLREEPSTADVDASMPAQAIDKRLPADGSHAYADDTGRRSFPDSPSIAVLPFQNMSRDPEQDYFADGIVEDIITALSHFRQLFVIARNSTFVYKGRAIDVKQVGRELGVRYVLEGSIRKSGNRLRITGQLIDAATGAHLWADRFDGALEDIFDLQDKLTQQVIGAIAPEIERAEIERASRRPISNVDAVTEYYRGLPQIYWPTNPENNDAALQHFRNAIALDPTFPDPYGGAAMCLMWRRNNRWPADFASDDAELLRLADRVKELGTDDAATLSSIGFALFFNRVNFEAGIEMVDRAIRSNPNLASAYNARGWLRAWDGGSDEAIADLERSMRLSPRDPLSYTLMLGIAHGHFNAGRYAEAAIWADRSIRSFPYFIGGLATAIAFYVEA